LQTSVLDTYQLFLTRVADGRGMTIEAVDAIGQGRVWTGQEAFERGLVDELGGLHTAIRRAKLEVGLEATADVYLIPFPKELSLGEQLVQAFQMTLVEAAAPSLRSLDWTAKLPGPLKRIAAWTRDLPSGTPLLIPPVMIEIR
jgi:ClpP class serine protease